MKKRIVWLILSCVMAASLVLSSCAPEAEPTPTPVPAPAPGEDMVKIKAVKLDGTVVEKMVEKPKYGGVLNGITSKPPGGFDSNYGSPSRSFTLHITNEELGMGDWARGLAGTGETDHMMSVEALEWESGYLAESWEIPDAIWSILPPGH